MATSQDLIVTPEITDARLTFTHPFYIVTNDS